MKKILRMFPLLALSVVSHGVRGQAVEGGSAPAQQSGAGTTTTSSTQTGQVTKSAAPATQTTTTTTPPPTSKGKPAGANRKTNAAPAPPPKPVWDSFRLNPKTKLFLDFTDANADMVFSIFSRASGVTILKDPSFKMTLTLNSASKVDLDDAFEILNTALDLNGYELQKRGKLLVVGKKQPPAPPAMQAPPPPPAAEPKPELKVYKLLYSNATQVARVINEVFTQQQLENLVKQISGQQQGGFPGQMQFGGGQPAPQPPKAVRASSEDYSNSVIVTALPEFQTQVASLIKQLDLPSDLPLESKIYKLKYVAVDDIVDAVTNVLNSNAPTGRGAGKPQDQNQGFYGYYNPYGSRQSTSTGSQTAIAVKASNTLVVSASPANIAVLDSLIESLDIQSDFVGTTQVIQLKNAKATDLADLLNNAFTKKKDQGDNQNPFFYIYGDDGGGNNNKKNDKQVDLTEDGRLVNVRDLTGKVNVMADANTNSLIVVTLPSNMKIIRDVIDRLDKIGDQVMIETIIVEANLDKTTKLGVEWNFLQNKAFNQPGWSGSGSNTYGLQNPATTSTTPNTGLIYTLTGKNFSAFVNALQTDSRFKVLDTPRIFTSNNVKAVINVSTQVPYITAQQSGTIIGGGLLQNYDFKNVGVVLTVTPRIASSGQVAMDIDQSADDLQGFTSYNAPIINHRQATTSATVLDGETIVLGGIIEHGTNTTENKIPILGDLPVLGPLFRSTSHEKTQTELLVFLTPHIVRNDGEAQAIRKTQEKELSPGSQSDVKNAEKSH